MKSSRSFLLIVAGCILFLLSILSPSTKDESGQHSLAVQFQNALQKKESKINALIAGVSLEKLSEMKISSDELAKLRSDLNQHNSSLFLFRKDSLVFWSDNTIEGTHAINGFQELNNGYYRVLSTEQKDLRAVVFMKLKSRFPYRNEYLQEEFSEGFQLPDHVTLNNTGEGVAVKNEEGKPIFYLNFPLNQDYSDNFPLLFLVSLFLLLAGAFSISRSTDYSVSLGAGIPFGLFLFIVGILITERPGTIFESELFDPAIYSNSYFFPSLGVFCLKALAAFSLVLVILRISIEKVQFHHVTQIIVSSGLITWITWSISSLISDSSIHFELAELLSLNRYSFLALAVIASSFLFLLNILVSIPVFELSKSQRAYTFTILILLPYLITFFYFSELGNYALLLSTVCGSILLLRRYLDPTTFLLRHLTFIFLLTAPLTFILEEEMEEKHFAILKSEAESLSEARDPILEFLFSDLKRQIEKDENLKMAILNREMSRDDILLMLRHRYFKGYWNKFDLSFSSYDSICNVIHQVGTKDKLPLYEQIINSENFGVTENLFYHQEEGSSRPFYLGKIDLSKQGMLCGVLYLQFTPVYFPEQPGYPELLMNRKKGESGLHYSWAHYEDKKLLASDGSYSFPLTFSIDTIETGKIQKKYEHYFYSLIGSSRLIITAKQEESVLQKASVFSFLFLLIFLSYLFTFPIFSIDNLPTFRTRTFRSRIYSSFFLLTFFGFGFAGLASYYFIRQHDRLKNRELIEDKMHTALSQFKDVSETLLKLDPVINPFLDIRVDQIANNLRSDVNLYDLNGTLLSSSSPGIFEEKLQSNKMNPVAFQAMRTSASSVFLHEESIGKLNYLSGYMPVLTPDGKVLGFLNLPYFAGEKELKQDINSVVQALMNLYLLLFILALALAAFLSSRLSGPLRLLQGKLSTINLQKENEILEWKQNDEIGDLINQYNKMVGQLASSAEKLAMSERESAWKEMARQVAHEIKNPLTPMKLSVQHLQKAVNEKAPDIEARIERFTNNLVEQIDTLSRIASEFSDFARLPEAQKENINLRELLSGILETFRNDSEYELIARFEQGDFMIHADRNQMIRVFNNLLKNSVQALTSEKKGIIRVEMLSSHSGVMVAIADNGRGIPEEVVANIFTPRFTTKSGGMGLGLSMVRSIIESHNGLIYFQSQEGSGTTFYIELPPAK